jgi:hypothetical protein
MLIALLAVLGVDLIVVVVLMAGVVGRRRWVSHQAGAFRGIIRVVDGQVPHLSGKGRRGYGRWVRDVLIWTPAPFFLRNAFAAIDAVEGTTNPTGRVRRLGDNPRVVTLTTGSAHLDIILRAEDVVLVTSGFRSSRAVTTPGPLPDDNEAPDTSATG